MEFYSLIQEYLEKSPSLQCMPVYDKAPSVHNWQDMEVTDDTIESWSDANIKHNGFGVRSGQPLGNGYRLGFVDYDTDDGIIISKLDELFDIANICVKKGKKGKTVFFKYKGDPEKGKFNFYLKSDKKRPVVEIFLYTGQTVLPPSMHPEGYQYKWINNSLLNLDVDELPELFLERIYHVDAVLNAPSFQEAIKTLPTIETGEGSGKFLTMTKMATALIMQGFDDPSIAKTLIQKDRDLFPGNQFFHSAKIGAERVANDDLRSALNWITKYRLNLMKDPKVAEKLLKMSKNVKITEEDNEWPELIPLESIKDTRHVEFDEDLFPPIMKDYCFKNAEASNLPPEAFMMGLFTSFSTVCQKRIIVHPTPTFSEYASISSLIVAPSGSRKDSILDVSMSPLKKLIERDNSSIGADFIEKEKTIIAKIEDLTKKKKKAIEAGDEAAISELSSQVITLQDELTNHTNKRPDFIFESGTQERAFRMIKANRERGIMFHASEYIGFLGTINKLGNDGLRAFFLKAINGSPKETFVHSTISGTNVNESGFSGNAFMGTQSDIFAEEFRKIESGTKNDGMLQRFIVIPVNPQIKKMKIVEKIESMELDNKFCLWYDLKETIDMYPTDEAQKLYIDFDEEIRLKAQYDISAVKSWKHKYSGKMPIFAALYEQLNAGPGKISKVISAESMRKAIRLMYIQSAQLDLLINRAVTSNDLQMAYGMMDAIKCGEISNGSKVDKFRQKFKSKEANMSGALRILMETHHVRVSRSGVVEVNPRVY